MRSLKGLSFQIPEWLGNYIERRAVRRYKKVGLHYGALLFNNVPAPYIKAVEREFYYREGDIKVLGYEPYNLEVLITLGGHGMPCPELLKKAPPMSDSEGAALTPHDAIRETEMLRLAVEFRDRESFLNFLGPNGAPVARPREYMFLYTEIATSLAALAQKLSEFPLPDHLKPLRRSPKEWLSFILGH